MIDMRCSGNPQCGYIGHVSVLGGLRLSTAIFIFFQHLHRKAKRGVQDGRPPFISKLYKISRPYVRARAFTHVLQLDAVDVGLHMWHALHDTKDKKRHIGRQKA